MKIKTGIGANISNSSDYKPSSTSYNINQLVLYDREYKNSLNANNNAAITATNPFKLKGYKRNNNVKFPVIDAQEETQQAKFSASNPFSNANTSISFAAVRTGYQVELSQSGKEAIQKLNNLLSISQNEVTKKDLLKQELSSFYRATLGRKTTRALAFSI